MSEIPTFSANKLLLGGDSLVDAFVRAEARLRTSNASFIIEFTFNIDGVDRTIQYFVDASIRQIYPVSGKKEDYVIGVNRFGRSFETGEGTSYTVVLEKGRVIKPLPRNRG